MTAEHGTVPMGIVELAHTLGRPLDAVAHAPDHLVDAERIRAAGYRTFHRADARVGATDLAAEAGRSVLDKAGVAPGDVDLLVLALSDVPEYLYWEAAAATQAKVGAERAEASLVSPTCGGGVTAFDLVAGKFATHPGYQNALVIGANRVCEPYWNRMDTTSSVYSDGAAAALVRRGHPARRWLATEVISDGRYADFTRMDIGGTAHPFAPGVDAPSVQSASARLQEFFDGDVTSILDFLDTVRDRNREVVRRACDRTGLKVGDLARIIHFNDSAQVLTQLAGDLEVPAERFNLDMLGDYAHSGCADQLISLERYLALGAVRSGDVVALTATGIGMHWMCTLLRI
ncbi:3-oxoacyl-[acyl-carrier-protein] synthase III C-terminal domain-containing protein [Streptomyces sp. NPDC005438]|uniref:3-oxoacyl-ACP synthase III family protein n=1 Tax=Streptomyces sp. NPDC005438 TaxID=3156880 RepID=UPI0033A8C94B